MRKILVEVSSLLLIQVPAGDRSQGVALQWYSPASKSCVWWTLSLNVWASARSRLQSLLLFLGLFLTTPQWSMLASRIAPVEAWWELRYHCTSYDTSPEGGTDKLWDCVQEDRNLFTLSCWSEDDKNVKQMILALQYANNKTHKWYSGFLLNIILTQQIEVAVICHIYSSSWKRSIACLFKFFFKAVWKLKIIIAQTIPKDTNREHSLGNNSLSHCTTPSLWASSHIALLFVNDFLWRLR